MIAACNPPLCADVMLAVAILWAHFLSIGFVYANFVTEQ